MATVGIHAIWTTYATWLPGDARGHWSALFDLYGRLIDGGHRLNVPDKETNRRSRELAKEPERILTAVDQTIIADIIGNVLRDDLHGRVQAYAGAVERTHVHLLFGPTNENIDSLVGKIKSKTSSAVIKNGSERWRTRTWTTGFWKVFLFEEASIPLVQEYIENHNVRGGLAAAPYPWIRRFA